MAREKLGRAVLGLALGLLACGGGGDDAVVSLDLDAGGGAGLLDARVVRDAELVRNDAGDGAVALADESECVGPLEQVHSVRSAGRVFSTVVLGNRVYVAYLVPTCGGSLDQSNTQGIELLSLSTSAAAGPPLRVVSDGASDCHPTSSPVLLATQQGGLNLLYASSTDSSDGMQVFLKAALETSAPVQLTMGAQTPLEGLSARLDNAQAMQVLYARAGVVSALRSNGGTRGLTAPAAGFEIRQLAVTNVGTTSADSAAAVGFISESESSPGAYVRFFDDSGGLGDAVQLTSSVRAESGIALATQTTRGAVVYSDGLGSLFLRTLERGNSVGAEVRLTSGNQSVSDVSIARYGIGYVVAFRSVTATSQQSVVRIMAVDELGNQGGTRFIAESRRDGTGLDVRVANDGRLVLSWADPAPASDAVAGSDTTQLETTIKIARLTCP